MKTDIFRVHSRFTCCEFSVRKLLYVDELFRGAVRIFNITLTFEERHVSVDIGPQMLVILNSFWGRGGSATKILEKFEFGVIFRA